MTRNKYIRRALIVIGSGLTTLGLILSFAKGSSTLLIMSLPVLIVGFLMRDK